MRVIGGLDSGTDTRRELVFTPHETSWYQVAVVALLTCGCRSGRGHRMMANPTGASLTLSTWDAGYECLRRRGVI